MSLIDKMVPKIDEIGSSFHGYEVSNRVLEYLRHACILDFCCSLDSRSQDSS